MKLVGGENITTTLDVPGDTLTLAVLSEAIRDIVAAFVVAGDGMTVTHDDPGDTLTLDATVGGLEAIYDALATFLVATSGLSKVIDDAGDTITLSLDTDYLVGTILATILPGTGITVVEDAMANTVTISASGSVTLENVMDALGTAQLVEGAGIDLTYDDAALSGVGTITIASSITQYTDEMARDAVGAAIVAGNNIDVTVDDGANTITIDVESLTSADLSDFATAVDERARDALGTALTAGTGITVTPNDGADTITIAGTVTQYTDEMVRDVIGAALVAGTNITITVDDGANTITIDATGGGAGVTLEQVYDALATVLVAGTNMTITPNDGADTITFDATGGGGGGVTLEQVYDALATVLTASTGITITPNDGADTITFASTITQYTDEMARDALGTALVAGNNIDITVNDGSDTITIDVESLTSADLSDFATAVDERARDALGSALTAGANITVTPNDGADTITLAVTGAILDALLTAAGDVIVRNATIPQRLAVGTDGQVLTVDTALAHKTKWATIAAPSGASPWLPPPVGRLICPIDWIGGTTAGAAMVANRMYATPIVITATTAFDRIAIHTNAVTAGNIRLGIYNCGSDGLPSSLELDAGVIASASSAYQALTISKTLNAGRYWLAFLADTGFSVQNNSGNSIVATGSPDGSLSSPLRQFPYRSFTYGALPDPFGTITAYLTNVPIVGLRVA